MPRVEPILDDQATFLPVEILRPAEEMADLGVRLADFQLSLPQAAGASEFESTQQLHDAVLGSLETILGHLEEGVQCAKLGALVDWIHDFLKQSLFLLAKREQDGHIRECHGDLPTRDIVRWSEKRVPFDSLEFDPKLRRVDTMNDVAFLFMDLCAHDRRDLAFVFLNAYLSRTGDYGGVRLLQFYSTYRALLRAMVDLRSAQSMPGERESHRERARLRLTGATELLGAKDRALIIMHGPSCSGKSFVSALLAERLGGVRISSDVERKRLQDKAGAAVVRAEEFNRRIYEHLFECAKSCLQGGLTAIVDAAFLDPRNRHEFAAWAECHGIAFLIVSCEAELSELESRMRRRDAASVDPSDAGLAVLHRQLGSWVPLGVQEKSRTVTINTMRPEAVQEAVPRLRAML
jgi:predicted kinase